MALDLSNLPIVTAPRSIISSSGVRSYIAQEKYFHLNLHKLITLQIA
jgi:hypothetical protein